jgi:Zn-dependent protease with chaperone function
MNTQGIVRVERWPTELPLLVLVVMAAAGVWALLALSIFGIVYAAFIAVFLFLGHVGFIAYVRGSAVRVGPEQLPELDARVRELSARAGLPEPPAAYVMQAGGSLNAFATKLFRSRMIVLFSDLLDACGDDAAARDMIIGHELGHIRAGHLSWAWVIVPGLFVPFLGGAYMRARERTCDRYGAALCGDRDAAIHGLTILAAGGARAKRVNHAAFVRQLEDLDTGWMTLARWLAAYPPLAERVALVDPQRFATVMRTSGRGPARAIGLVAVAGLIPLAAGALFAIKMKPLFEQAFEQARLEAERQQAQAPVVTLSADQVRQELERFSGAALAHLARHGALPADEAELYEAWRVENPGGEPPRDLDGLYFGYHVGEAGFVLWSVGLDGVNETVDDVVLQVPVPTVSAEAQL